MTSPTPSRITNFGWKQHFTLLAHIRLFPGKFDLGDFLKWAANIIVTIQSQYSTKTKTYYVYKK